MRAKPRSRRGCRVGSGTVITSPFVFMMDAILVFLGLFGTAASVVTGFQLLPERFLALLLPLCLLLAMLSCIVQALRGVVFLALVVVCQGLSVVARLQWDTVVAGCRALFADVVNTTVSMMGGVSGIAAPVMTAAVWMRSVGLVLFLAAVLLALYLGWSVARRRSAFWTFLPTFALVLPSLLAELWPWWPGFMMLVACWVTLFLCALCRHAPAKAVARLAALALPLTAALLTALSLLLPQKDYEQPDWALMAYGDLVDLGTRVVTSYEVDGLDGILPQLTAGAADAADLGAAGSPSYAGRTMLEVTADSYDRLYLRGVSLGDYEDGRWEPLPERVYEVMPVQLDLQGADQPLYYPAQTQQTWLEAPTSQTYTVTVRNRRAMGRYVYAPYGLLSGPMEDAVFHHDAGLRAENGQRIHEIRYLPETLNNFTQHLSGETAQAESAYRAFVYQNYLSVPDGFMEAIMPWREDAYQIAKNTAIAPMEIPRQYQTAVATARGWAALLAATTEYDLEVTTPPDGQDPVIYFLNESRRGYCMYYATAATLLLRSSGIPARYVSGFVSDVAPGVTAVPDSSAHAWTEIYLDGYGWYPIEVTPAAGVDATAVPNGQATPVEPEPDEPPKKPDAPEPEKPSAIDAAADVKPSAQPLPGWLLFVPLTALAVALPLLRRQIARHKRAAQMNPANPNGAVIAAYGWLQGLSRFGAEITNAVEELARKAKFSQHTLTQEECTVVLVYLEQENARVDGELKWHQRLLLRYWYGLY